MVALTSTTGWIITPVVLLLNFIVFHAAAFQHIFPTATVARTRRPTSSCLAASPLLVGERARAVFDDLDVDGSGSICVTELNMALQKLGISAKPEEVNALFIFLDENGDGEICFDEFMPWYTEAASEAETSYVAIQNALLSRITVHHFEPNTKVSMDVLRRAVECAIHAPNHHLTEPWRFIDVGPETIEKIASLNADMIMLEQQEDENNINDLAAASKRADAKRKRWNEIPGWCVITTKLSPDDEIREQEDFAATSCAVQNFMLSLWSEGVGTKWTTGAVTRTKEFADLCGVDVDQERVVGCIWYGFASDLISNKVSRKKNVNDVLSSTA